MLVLLILSAFRLDFCPSGMIAGVSVPIEMVLSSMRADRRLIGVNNIEKRDLREETRWPKALQAGSRP
jgi:hypothetical protein